MADRRQVTVVSGPARVLVERDRDRTLALLEKEHPTVDVVRLDCGAKADPESGLDSFAIRLAQALSPSLFGDEPIVIVEGLEHADADTVALLKDAVGQAGSPLLITHSGAARGRGVINAAKKAGAEVLATKKPRERDARTLMRQEARESGGRLEPPAEQWLLDAVGPDSLELLLALVRQSIADSESGHVGQDDVHHLVPMQARTTAFMVVDHLWARDVPGAVGVLRAMEGRQKGVGVAVVAALAHGVRMMALMGRPGAKPPTGFNAAPWQVDRARDNLRRWGATPARLARLAAHLPDLDAAMKGGVDGGVALDDEQKLALLEGLVIHLAGGELRRAHR